MRESTASRRRRRDSQDTYYPIISAGQRRYIDREDWKGVGYAVVILGLVLLAIVIVSTTK